ncbi:hypothetical protein B0T14DRAFT_495936 [Immersiella caudata]|uniref:DUF6594 domain-containing protein n=1 Tax=Immersiella caudata TaxID=314043 RepID=A0AA39WPH9_9PEZI|nr:hypothetical protein B0T14DRAFT_495936 [Immersiella caudata]
MDLVDQPACFADIIVQNPSSPQWRTVLELRECLHQYNRALIELAQVSALPKPSTIKVQALFQWMMDGSGQGGNSKVNGSGSKAWGNQSLIPPPPRLPERTRALLRSVFLFWKDQPGRTNRDFVMPCNVQTENRGGFEDTFGTHPDTNMQRFTTAAATILACLLPTLAISMLTTARGMTETLLYIGGFTILFAIGLMILARETTTLQIFTATAA